MRVIERQFSDLLRHPKQVTSDLEDSDVLLRRRDEPDLQLTRADREAQRTEAFSALARAFRNLAVHSPAVSADALADAFTWLEFLPLAERQQFVDEFARVISAAAELDNYTSLGQLIHEWRTTAELHADPKLARRLSRQIEARGEAVPLP